MPKKKAPEHVNLERWMVSYADFMTLLLAVFVVLYAFAMAKQSEAQSMAQSVAQAFNEKLVSATGGVLLIPGSLEEVITAEASKARESAESAQPEARSEESGGTIMNFTSAGSPDSDSPNSTGGNSGEDEGQNGQSSSDVSSASGDLIVSDTKTRSKGSPHTMRPDGGSDSGLGGFTPGSDGQKIAEGGRTEVNGQEDGEGMYGTPFDSIRRSVTQTLADNGLQEAVEIEQDEHWLTLNINSGLLFAKDSASILTRARPIIAHVASALSSINNYIRVRGYTDDSFMPDGIFKNSWQLASQRAVNVLNELVDDGLEPERMAVESYGQYHPFVSNATDAGRALNRRVVIAISRYAMAKRRQLQIVSADGSDTGSANTEQAGDGSMGIVRSEDDGIILQFNH